MCVFVCNSLNKHTNIPFWIQFQPQCSFHFFLHLPMIKDAWKRHPDAVYQMQPCRRVRYAAFEATFGMWNIKQGLCQVRSHGTFWWHALLFTALSAPFSLVLRVFLRLSAPLSSLSFAPFWLLFAVLARAFAEAWVPPARPPARPPFEWQLKDRNVLCWLLLTECRWSKVNLWENTGAWNANCTIPGLAGAVGEESSESSKFLLESFLSWSW